MTSWMTHKRCLLDAMAEVSIYTLARGGSTDIPIVSLKEIHDGAESTALGPRSFRCYEALDFARVFLVSLQRLQE